MPLVPQGRPPLKRKAEDDSPDTETPDPGTKRVQFLPTKIWVSPPGPIPDDETQERDTAMYNRILQYRTQIIKDRVAAAAALEYNPTDLAVNVKLAQEMIMEGIKNAMVWNPSFDKEADSNLSVTFKYGLDPGTAQVLRVLFPGVGVQDAKGKSRGWRSNVYSPAEFRDIMGTDMIARLGSSLAEISGWVGVYCQMNEGWVKVVAKYRELKVYPPTLFPQTVAKR